MPDATGETLFDGAALQALREAKGWTQAEVAERIGATRAAVQQWERGRNVPRWPHAVALARLFKVSLDKFIAD